MLLSANSDEYLKCIPSEICSKNNILAQRKDSIHNYLLHYHQVSKDIHSRNQTLQSYALKLMQTKQIIENDRKKFQESQIQKNDQFKKEYETLENELNELSKKKEQIVTKITKQKDYKNCYNQKIEEKEKMINESNSKINKKNKALTHKQKYNCHNLENELEQLSIVFKETESHCKQFQECINSLNNDFGHINKIKHNIHKKKAELNQRIFNEKSSFTKLITDLLVQSQNERTKQDEYRKEKEKSTQSINYLQSKIEKIKKNNYLCNEHFENSITNERKLRIAKEILRNRINELNTSIKYNNNVKMQIYSQIKKERNILSQRNKDFKKLSIEKENLILNESINSTNFPVIFDVLNKLQELWSQALLEIEKWKNSPLTNVEQMLYSWNSKMQTEF